MDLSPVATSLIAFFSGLTGWKAYSSILGVLFICGLGVPLPEDITLIIAGLLAAHQNISLWGAMLAGFFGVLVGDCLLFFIGRHYGHRVLRLPFFRSIFTEQRVRKAETRIRANARLICFTARFLPGLRAPIYLTAGTMGVKPGTFLFQDGVAALISVPIWVYLGYWFGLEIDRAIKIAKEIQIFLLAGIFIIFLSWLFYRHRNKKRSQSSTI